MKPLFIASFLKPEEIKTNIQSFVAKIATTRAEAQAKASLPAMINISFEGIEQSAKATLASLQAAAAIPVVPAEVKISPEVKQISINAVTTQDLESKDPLASFEKMLSEIPKDTAEMDLIIIGHGTVVANQHFITFEKQEAHAKVDGFIRTKDLFSKIATALPTTKVSILFDSCFGGMAQADKDVLTVGSSLYSISSDETPVAAMPTNKTLEDYPTGQDYTPEQFINMLLAKRALNFASTKQGVPDHLVEMIPERVVKGTPENDYSKMYIYNTKDMDMAAFKGAIPTLRATIDNDSYTQHFLKDLSSEIHHTIECTPTPNMHMAEYDHLLSWLAFNTDTGVQFKPSAKFANAMECNIKLNVTFDQYNMLFNGDHQKDFSNPSLLDLLMIKYEEHCTHFSNSEQKHKDIAIDTLMQKITGNVTAIPNPYAAVNILCDITKDHLGEHFLRVGLVANELNAVTLMVIPMNDDDLSELLSGKITSTYDYFVAKLRAVDLSKIFTVVKQYLAQDVGAAAEEVIPKLQEIGNMIVSKLNKATDKFGANFCKQLDKAVADMVKFHELAIYEPTDDRDLIIHCADYAKAHPEQCADVMELAGNPPLRYDINLGEFME